VDSGYLAKERKWLPDDARKLDIYPTTAATRDSFHPNKTSVLTNYVHVRQLPNKIFVYSITNCPKFKKKDGSAGQRVLSWRKELKSVFADLQPHLTPFLSSVSWATDDITLWTTGLIFNNHGEEQSFSIDYISLGGQRLNPLQVVVKLKKTLTTIQNNLHTKNVEDCSEEIEALNALVSQPVLVPRSEYTVTQAGPNRFFINEGYKILRSEKSTSQLDPVALRAVRGYFTSIRLGKDSRVLLNVNTTTSAFFPLCRVSDILYYVGMSPDVLQEVDLDDIEKWLRGVQLYIAYMRKAIPTRAVSINDPKSRLKSFQNFGASVVHQRFYDDNDDQDIGRTVLEYFQTGNVCSPITLTC
jgi:hypothetical protein